MKGWQFNRNRYLARAVRFAILGAASGMAMAVAPAVVQAQTAPPVSGDSAGAPDGVLDEVIVSARFKRESAQDAPQAITAFGEAQLAKMAARDLTDLTASTPNVNIQSVSQFRTAAAIAIRGMGAGGIESTEESPIGVSVDGVFVTRPVGTMLDTFDMQRVEVLRGPQGVSFGKNSLAGGIAAYTRNPGEDFGGNLELTAGNYGRADAKASIDVPIIEDKLKTRLVVAQETIDGWYNNRVDGSTLGKAETFTVRGTVDWTATDDFSLNLKAFKIRDRSDMPGGDAVQDRTKLLWLAAHFEEPNDGPYNIGRDFPSEQELDQWGLIANANLTLGGVTLTSITGYIETDDSQQSDYDQAEVFFFSSLRNQTHDQFSQELRLTTNFGRLELVAGGYYLDQEFAMTQAFPTLPALVVPPSSPLSNSGSQDYVTQTNTAKALFGQAIYGITDDLNVTFGVRESWESKDYFRDPTGTLITPAFFKSYDAINSLDEMHAIAEANYAAGRALKDGYDRQRTTFKAGVDYSFNDDVMGYFTFSQGYKGGGYGARAGSVSTMGPTEDNTSELLEAGVKGEFFDRSLRVNLTAFQSKFKNLQFAVFFSNPNVPTGQETAEQNIGAATTRGIELESTWQATDALALSANVGYLDAEFTDFCADLDGPRVAAGTPTSNCGGEVTRLPNGAWLVDEDHRDLNFPRSPEWQAQAAAEYNWDLGGAGSLLARASLMYKSEYYSTLQAIPEGESGDYSILDSSLTWQSVNGRYRAMLWGKNLTDETYVSGLTPTAQFFTQRFYSPPRTYGLTFSVTY